MSASLLNGRMIINGERKARELLVVEESLYALQKCVGPPAKRRSERLSGRARDWADDQERENQTATWRVTGPTDGARV